MSSSAIYEGTVSHRRLAPVQHAFRYRVCMLYLDLAELPGALDVHPLWSSRRPAPGRFRRADHLGDAAVPLPVAVRAEVERLRGTPPAGPIRLLATPRTFGHAFNPVSFFFCFAPDGETVDTVLAEVTNTPWGERHAYVTDGREGVFDKALHVSPFMPMEQLYTWRATTPDDTLKVHIASNDDNGDRAFDATLVLDRRPLRLRGLARLPGLRTLALIYGHAVALKLKGVPVQPHPAR